MRLAAERFHLSRPSGTSGRILYTILLGLILCTISIRSQSSLTEGSQDSPTTTESIPVQPNTTTSPSSNDSSAVSTSTLPSSAGQSSPLPGSSPNGTTADDGNQFGSSSDNPPDLAGTQTTATTLPANTSTSTSVSRSSQPVPPPKQSAGDSGGLSGGAVAGIVFVSIVGGVALFAGVIMYFRRLERSIAQDKREIREKQARRYNQLEQNRHTSYIPGNQPQPYEL
ncbi:hypothetical protein PGT21_003921 [Puccinia graminis f. sp. tritici]|uniref:Uncharacterized protein n=2 Tax=Puccinia graminis f. sp. tritici TaxID=56615 RepID=E3JY24_PUCGT|nr:uncharacterized protein PGTG_02410 [Puccinia graminis f. sp. tritici CRL 75-36-700-3]EFP76949.2 hypothetical protein PGTG_02410 [Puccinia graminis f. sp. tritici CRL 75-36-700-3]KAA1118732.1 hypothetical protein PGT21_003921 [Puccinia graminis f. sp. tritici]